MTKVLFLLFSLSLFGCADYAPNASVDGVHRPGDLVPQPFPEPRPDDRNQSP